MRYEYFFYGMIPSSWKCLPELLCSWCWGAKACSRSATWEAFHEFKHRLMHVASQPSIPVKACWWHQGTSCRNL